MEDSNVYGLTDIGKVRETNEDQFLIADLTKSMRVSQTSLSLDKEDRRLFGGSQGKLLLVADGMGGHEGGEQASRIAVEALTRYVLNVMRWLFRLEEDTDEDFQDDLKSAMEHCQEKVEAELEGQHREAPGTTLTLGYVIWPRLYVVHVGDSRCYLWRDSKLKQITKDHTMAQRLVDDGNLEEEETTPWSHVLWNVIGGGSEELAPEVYKAKLRRGDTLLLCTDGLTKHLSDEDLANLLGDGLSSRECTERLVARANDAEGSDNTTVVVARF
jgi:protein phosphatase